MWLFLIETGFVGFVLSLFGLVWRGFERDGKRSSKFWPWLMVVAFCFALWLVALPRVPRPPVNTEAAPVAVGSQRP